MALNPQYMLAPALQQLFRDKDTGLPLSNGKVFFYEDDDRNVLKPVYMLTGAPPTYSYTPIPTNPDGSVSLNSVGAFEEAVYYFPFAADGVTVQLYYIEVYDSTGDILQLTREGYPNFSEEEVAGVQDVNFISNGRFLVHRDLPNDGLIDGLTSTTDVAYGGWKFVRDVAASPTSLDYVTFTTFEGFFEEPPVWPRFAIKIESAAEVSGSLKELRIRFDNVNTFASDQQQYTLGFWAKSNSSDINVEIIIRKNYGTGGSTPDAKHLSPTLDIDTDWTAYRSIFTFGENSGKVIGPLNDDYVEICLSLPLSELFEIELTDFFLFEGSNMLADFEVTTNRTDIMTALGGGFVNPNPDGSDIGLPIILTKSGLDYDDSQVGKIFSCGYAAPGFGEALCNGQGFRTATRSDEGIPYTRLSNKLYDTTNKYPVFGTGFEHSAAMISADQVLIFSNTSGIITAAANGSTSPGFTYKASPGLVNTAIETGLIDTATIICIGNNIGEVSEWTVNTSGFSISVLRNDGVHFESVHTVTTIAASAMTAADYFRFYTYDGGIQSHYAWYKIGGTGVDPAPGGTGVLIQLETTDTAAIVAQKTAIAMTGRASDLITTVVAASIPASSYFTFNAKTNSSEQEYYVWFKKDGMGADPAVAGAFPIEVDITTGQTAAQVSDLIRIGVNKAAVGTPDLRGKFIRGWDNGSGFDEDAASRYIFPYPILYGDKIGSEELDSNLYHYHSYLHPHDTDGAGGSGIIALIPGDETLDTGGDGNYEGRPRNISLNYVIKI